MTTALRDAVVAAVGVGRAAYKYKTRTGTQMRASTHKRHWNFSIIVQYIQCKNQQQQYVCLESGKRQ